MPSPGDTRGWTFAWQRANATHIALTIMAAVILMQIELVFTKSINWDEFFHFSQIHRHLQDRPTKWLQVPFVWLFSWVPSLPGSNISHIQLIRLLILPFELVAVCAIVASAQRFASREAALFCGLFYITGGYVFLHAFALRADMIAASLLTVALWIGICRPVRPFEIAAMAILVTLAFVSTIKSIFYAPAFLGVALFRMQKTSHRWTIAGIVAALLMAGMFLLRLTSHLPTDGMAGIVRDIGELGLNSANRMFSAGLFPQPRWLQGEILRAPLLALAVILALAIALVRRDRAPMERLLLVSLLAPLCAVVFYRNAFPYFFVFILPPAMIATAPAIGLLLRRYGLAPLSLLLLASAAALSLMQDRSVLPRQRIIQAGLHEIFPTPVTYIDDCGILSDFPRAVNRFASGWALANYRDRQLPAYKFAIEAEPVPLLLADSGLLGTVCFDLLYRGALLREDHRTIQENYLPHWGNAFVAGRRIAAGNEEHTFQIVVPGTYTVEGGPIVVDGRLHSAGGVMELGRGSHVASGNRPTAVTLRWGAHLHRPSYPWPHGTVFTEY